MKYRSIVQIAVATLLTSQVGASSLQKALSLKEHARKNGGRASYTLIVETPFASLANVVTNADLIVRARIARKESGLTEDEDFVRTYFTFVPSRVFKDRIGIGHAPTPRMTIPLVFVESYGVVQVDGLVITQTCNAAADPQLKVGDQVLLFLTKSDGLNGFRLEGGPFGLLKIQGRSVIEPNKEVASARGLTGKSVSDIEEEIERLLKTPADK